MSRIVLIRLLVVAALSVAGVRYGLPYLNNMSDNNAEQSVPVATDSMATESASPNYSVDEAAPEEVVWGKASAPIIIIEYASMTCNHCAAFHTQTFPELKTKYIDTGLVQLRLRPFPLDAYAMSAAMLVSCVAPIQKQGFVHLLFAQQQKWISAANIFGALQRLARQAGLSEEDVIACIQDESVLNNIRALQKQAVDELKVQSTPTFFINGTRLEGNHTFIAFEKNIIPLLPEVLPEGRNRS